MTNKKKRKIIYELLDKTMSEYMKKCSGYSYNEYNQSLVMGKLSVLSFDNIPKNEELARKINELMDNLKDKSKYEDTTEGLKNMFYDSGKINMLCELYRRFSKKL